MTDSGASWSAEPRATRSRRGVRKRAASRILSYDAEHAAYYASLTPRERRAIDDIESDIDVSGPGQVPIRFRLLTSKACMEHRRAAMAHAALLFRGESSSSEKAKMTQWLESFLRLPMGVTVPPPVGPLSSRSEVSRFVSDARRKIDALMHGHEEAKGQIMRILAKRIANPGGGGAVIGIHGPPGCGKTTLVRVGVAETMGLPLQMISLGAASDGARLTGHQYTYEGATYGGIADCLIKARCMNPVILLDELDKVSATDRGREIVSALIHITDSSQNDSFHDNYFGSIPLDISQAVIVMTFNDPGLVDPVLLDRMTVVTARGYDAHAKRVIARRHILPRVCSRYGLTSASISDAAVDEIVRRVAPEEGVRNLDRGIDTVVGNVNLTWLVEGRAEPLGSLSIDVASVERHLPRSDQRGGAPPHMYT